MKDKLMGGFLAVAEVLQTNRYMVAIKNSFTALLPIIIAGAFAVLIANVVTTPSANGISLANFAALAWLSKLTPIFTAANYATLNFFAIGIVFLIAMELGKQYNHDELILPVVALASYITLCATSVTGNLNGETFTVSNVLARQFTNAQGLFMGMITAIVATELYCKVVDSGKLAIKMPETVPSNVAKAFNVLIPSILTIVLISTFGFVFQMIFGYSFYDAIAKWIQAPLAGILTGLPGYLFIIFCTTLLWIMGIHGTQTLKPIYEPIMILALTENLDLVNEGKQAVHILNQAFISCFSTVTGAGITGGLIIAILLFSKRDDFKAIAKLSIAPGIFNINETMTFGLPIVLNPILAVPFVLSPIVSATIGYYATVIGFAAPMWVSIPWTTPPILAGFLASGGHVGTAITQLIAILATSLVYIPFVLISNKQVAPVE